jgi:short-subunit dehydrogenase
MTKVIVITGASSGIGAEMARETARKGWQPVLLSRTETKLKDLQGSIRQEIGVLPIIHTLDVRNRADVERVFEAILTEVPAIDVLINNAGFAIFDRFADAKLSDIEDMFQTNVIGLMACTQAVLPKMLTQKKGHIINIASQAGKIATPKSSGYSATKHAVLGFTNSLRLELEGTNIHVTAVNPGPIETNFFSIADESGKYVENVQKYMLNPKEVAQKIIGTVENPKREINLPGWMNAGSKLYQLMPQLVEKIGGKAFKQK